VLTEYWNVACGIWGFRGKQFEKHGTTRKLGKKKRGVAY
jgi:hypothetical protein